MDPRLPLAGMTEKGADVDPTRTAGMTKTKKFFPMLSFPRRRESRLSALQMDPRLPLAGMTTGESSHFHGICLHVYAL